MHRRTHVSIAVVLALAPLGCQSPSRTPELGQAEAAYVAGDRASAIKYAETAIQKRTRSPEPEALDLLITLLREAGRDVEAAAFSEYVARYSTTQPPAFSLGISRRHCSQSSRGLVEDWGPLRKHRDFHIGTVAATFRLGSDGRVSSIRVARAKNPAAAWSIIHSIATLKIDEDRLAELDDSEYPLEQCAYWVHKRRERQDSGETTLPTPTTCMRGLC